MKTHKTEAQSRKTATGMYLAAGVLWAVCTALAIHQAMLIESTPGPKMGTPVSTTTSPGWRFVMIVHPECPCSEASLLALSEAVSKIKQPITLRILFAGDRVNLPTSNMKVASSISGATLEWLTPTEAQTTFGALTSGTLIIYQPDGKVAFQGGITPGRGVRNPDYAVNLISEIVAETSMVSSRPAFGCALSAGVVASK